MLRRVDHLHFIERWLRDIRCRLEYLFFHEILVYELLIGINMLAVQLGEAFCFDAHLFD